MRDRDTGFRDTMALLEQVETDSPAVLVGIRAEAGEEIVRRAAANEFGTVHNPERSFLRSTADRNAQRYAEGIEAALEAALDEPGEALLVRRLGRVGAGAVNDVQQAIVEIRTPPNAPSTIKRKGSSNPLIHTGRMRQSVDSVVEIRGEVRDAG